MPTYLMLLLFSDRRVQGSLWPWSWDACGCELWHIVLCQISLLIFQLLPLNLTAHLGQTYILFLYINYPTQELVDHMLRAYRKGAIWNMNTTEVENGGIFGWVTSTKYHQLVPNYSAICAPDYEYAPVAAHEMSNLWSWCPFFGNHL